MQYCGIDAGTSGVKAVVFDEKGNELAKAYRGYELVFSKDGTRALSPDDIWNKTKTVLAEVSSVQGIDIEALSVSSFGEAFVVLNDKDEDLFEVMVSTDRRGEEEFEEKCRQISREELIRICGVVPSASYSVSKIMYLKERRPDIYSDTRRILLIGDYIQYRLTGIAATDYSTACRTMLLDVNKLEWSERLLDLFEIDKDKLSELGLPGTVIGNISGRIAEEIGLSQKVKVIMGSHDQPMNAIGSGLLPGDLACSMGTSECLTPVFDKKPDIGMVEITNLPIEPIWEKGRYCTLAYNPTSGLLVQWFFENLIGEKTPDYNFYENNIPEEPTRIMVQPYLMGSGTPYMDSFARTAFTGIDLGTDRYTMYKAILEGLVLDQKLNLEYAVKMGANAKELVCSGGGAKNRSWLQLKADIMQIPVSTLKTKETGALGCAVVCAVAAGEYDSIYQAAKAMSLKGDILEPEMKNTRFYNEKYDMYKELHKDVLNESRFACI